ncbi:small RNA 2'-O-methyltransferase-like [Mytilus californianus]|uniref:small RNA 2'-O-methyltransferase-like n=1 Tax=Mytilus californianus TaxID=6549 RepID=UPI0022477497|nr:small RNA 2'-O-methyltransferase-like [Mytilus californianus]
MADNDCTSPRFSTEEHSEIGDLKYITASPTEKSPLDEKTSDRSENENCLGGPSFYPPLYIQRYTFVKEILDTLQPESVVDFGCSECGIFRHLKEVITLLRISLVDIDLSTLEVNKRRIRPHCYDYLQKRKNPLHVQIFDGSATKFDARFRDYEAVTMVEFIEHLYDRDLKEVITMVFECICPKFVIMTTPNFEFNELFPGPRKFRHYDHKFEWTRSQFQTWCNDICGKYRYDSKFYGIGEGPADSHSLGSCSQAAVFTRIGDKQQINSNVEQDTYSLVAESIYPHQDIEQRDPEEVLASEIDYALSFMSKCSDFYDEEETSAFIPIDKLISFKSIKSLCDSDQLREFLSKKNYDLSKNDKDEDCVCVELSSEDTRGIWYGDDEDELIDEARNTMSESHSEEIEIIHKLEEEMWD